MGTSQQVYPTDLNDTQWLRIRPYLPAEAPAGRPREHSWRAILSGIFYFLLPAIFYLWMGVLGGGGMIALALYIRLRW